MKVTRLLFFIFILTILILTMCRAVLMAEASYAAPSTPASPIVRRNASDRSHVVGPVSVNKANRSMHLPNSRNRSLPRNSMNPHRPDSYKSDGAARAGSIKGSIKNETGNTALPFRRLSVARPNLLSLNNVNVNVRHRGANPAVVGGLTNWDSRNASALNGTLMHRKP
jgi:hypothetical protein